MSALKPWCHTAVVSGALLLSAAPAFAAESEGIGSDDVIQRLIEELQAEQNT